MAFSSSVSIEPNLFDPQAFEQNLTVSQFRAHFFRKSMRRPQYAHILNGTFIESGFGTSDTHTRSSAEQRMYPPHHDISDSARPCKSPPFPWVVAEAE